MKNNLCTDCNNPIPDVFAASFPDRYRAGYLCLSCWNKTTRCYFFGTPTILPRIIYVGETPVGAVSRIKAGFGITPEGGPIPDTLADEPHLISTDERSDQ